MNANARELKFLIGVHWRPFAVRKEGGNGE